MKKTVLISLLLCAVLLCTACTSGSNEHYQVVTNTQAAAFPATVTAAPAVTDAPAEPLINTEVFSDYDSGTYDPSSEEGGDEESVADVTAAPAAVTAAPTMNSAYAGATPVVIDPIDKPTATPVPALSFDEFVDYDAYKIHVSFKGPAGWDIDDSASDTYILTNPDSSMAYKAQLTIKVVSVSSAYSKSDLTKECKSMLTALKSQFKSFSPSNTADRTLIDHTGVYANYTATTADGQEVAGRVHVTYVNKTLYEVHLTYPLCYRSTYVDTVYKQLRNSIAITQ